MKRGAAMAFALATWAVTALAGQVREGFVTVRGMVCSSCAGHVEKLVRGVEGVKDAKVLLKEDRVKVVYEEGRTDLAKVAEAIRKGGYRAEVPAAK